VSAGTSGAARELGQVREKEGASGGFGLEMVKVLAAQLEGPSGDVVKPLSEGGLCAGSFREDLLYS